MTGKFNIRVYGIWILKNRVLVSEEHYKDRIIHKFPGGGLEWGEGTRDCLAREWKEELNLDIMVTNHFYTTDFFQQSAFDGSQVISIYYLVDADPHAELNNKMPNERCYWIDISALTATTFTLPIDQHVGSMIIQGY